MNTVIYYFTGTGNTLAVVRNLALELGDTELVSIPKVTGQLKIVADADAVGIAFPVYFLDMPGIVSEFVKKIQLTKPYIFGIATCGERPGGALFNLKSLLEGKGATLSAGFAFFMPENYIGPIDLMGDAPHRQEKYAAAQSRIAAITTAIRERGQSAPEGSDSALLRLGGGITKAFATTLYNTPHRLHATANCNHCLTCERICPVQNITVAEDGVHWGDSCIQCYACIHWCPKEAIEIGARTSGKPRYHHPEVTLADMISQRGDA
ncbi:MAG TPA: EFR1 family ferrodoxin [Methanospirillum sp.]|nr:EFR1 family ferrodoxin [Methanospirillum sp.]